MEEEAPDVLDAIIQRNMLSELLDCLTGSSVKSSWLTFSMGLHSTDCGQARDWSENSNDYD